MQLRGTPPVDHGGELRRVLGDQPQAKAHADREGPTAGIFRSQPL